MSKSMFDNNIQKQVEQYKSEFTEHQLFVMQIAIEQLGSSFNLAKSNGFKKWLQKQNEPKPETKPETKPEPKPEVKPETKPKKKVVRKKKSPKVKHQNEPEEQQTTNQLITSLDKIDKILSTIQEWKDLRKETQPFIVTNETMSNLQPSGSLYCLFTTEKLLFVGTTSDTKKNLPLAYRTSKKTTTDEIHAIVLANDNSKQRVKMRDIIKKELISI